MAPHLRVLLFCLSFLVAPVLFSLGEHLWGIAGGSALAAIPVVALGIYASAGGGKPPAGTRPA